MVFIPFAGASLWMPTPLPHDPDRHHLFTLLTGAVGAHRDFGEREIAIVSVSSVRPGVKVDKSCVLNVGDHPAIYHASYVFYRWAKLVTVGALQRGIDTGEFSPRSTFAPEVHLRIVEGAHASELTPRKVKSFLRRHAS